VAVLSLVVASTPVADPLPAAALLLANGLVAGVALMAVRARATGPAGAFVGELYPLALMASLYTEVGLLNGVAGVSHDVVVQSWERAIFGGQASREWLRAWSWPWLSWILHLGYLSFYLILTVAPIGLWLSGRRDGARRTTLLVAVTFYVCCGVYLVFPVAGPRYAFPLVENPATSTAVARLTQRLLDAAAAWGTAFPSSHVAVAWVASVSAWLEWRSLGRALIPLAWLLTLGTVYGQFHYGVDALAGWLLAATVVLFRERLVAGVAREDAVG